MNRSSRPPHPDVLTPREWEVLELLRLGLSNEQIAERLGITLRTAKFHVSEILSKLGVESREQAAAWQPEEAPAPARRWLAWPLIARFAGALVMVAAVAGLGLLAWGVLRTGGAQESSSPSGTPMPTLALPTPGPSPMLSRGTSLTAEQREMTEQILHEDATVRALAGGSPMELGQIGPYVATAEDDHDILVGTTAYVTLTEPHDLTDMELPQATLRHAYGFWPGELQARYSPWIDRTQVVSVRNLTEFSVVVDLIRRRVVAVRVYSIDYLDQELTQPTPYTDPIFTGERRSKEAESIAKADPAASAVFEALDAEPRGSYSYEIGAHHFAYVSAWSNELSPTSGDWPVLVDQDPETGDYRSETVYVSGNAANTVWVTVDLDTRTVIDISTSERD